MKYIVAVALIIIAALFFLQKDEALSPLASQWAVSLAQDEGAESAAFTYLHGIMAAKGESPENVGKQLLTSYKEAEANSQTLSEGLDYETYPVEKELTIPNENAALYCAFSEENCFNTLIENKAKWETDITKHSVILERYRQFISFSEFTTLSKPSAYEPFPKYQYLKYGGRLALLENLMVAAQHSPEQALVRYTEELVKLRKHLALADTLVHKVFFTSLIADNLDAMAYIRYRYNHTQKLNIPYLTKSEQSIEAPLIREFGMMHTLYRELDGHPEFFEMDGNMPSWLVRIFFKPNKTINQSAALLDHYIQFSTLSPEAFAQLKTEEIAGLKPKTDYFNFAGSVLNNVASPDFIEYIAKVYDLNAKISLINYINSDEKIKLVNPYYPDKKAYRADKKSICLDGPHQDNKKLRCIDIFVE